MKLLPLLDAIDRKDTQWVERYMNSLHFDRSWRIHFMFQHLSNLRRNGYITTIDMGNNISEIEVTEKGQQALSSYFNLTI